MKFRTHLSILVFAVTVSSCATLTNDPNQQIQFVGINLHIPAKSATQTT